MQLGKYFNSVANDDVGDRKLTPTYILTDHLLIHPYHSPLLQGGHPYPHRQLNFEQGIPPTRTALYISVEIIVKFCIIISGDK